MNVSRYVDLTNRSAQITTQQILKYIYRLYILKIVFPEIPQQDTLVFPRMQLFLKKDVLQVPTKTILRIMYYHFDNLRSKEYHNPYIALLARLKNL